jgi:hypothetical protein
MPANAPVPTYPQFEKIFEEGRTEPFLRQVERTRLQLQQLQSKGTSAAERKRATDAFEAYTKALALLKEVDDERRKLAEGAK